MGRLLKLLVLSMLLFVFSTGRASDANPNVFPLRKDGVAKDISKTLTQLIELIIQPKNFRATTAEIERLIHPYCQKISEYADRGSYNTRYACGDSSHVVQVELFVVGNKRPEAYIRTLEIIFPIAFFEASKLQMRRKLGKPAQARPDMVRWPYEKDRYINKFGTPVFVISPYPKEGIASVQLALESGP